jgi:F0F1-type ATP synthase assembly protein I
VSRGSLVFDPFIAAVRTEVLATASTEAFRRLAARPTMASEDRTGSWLRYSHLGIQFCLTFGVFVALGMWADARLAWSPWLTVAGCALGMTAATYLLIRETGSKRE